MDLNNDKLTIYSVSTLISQDFYDVSGSLLGGTALYIRGVGFDRTADNNIVTVGPYACPVSCNF